MERTYTIPLRREAEKAPNYKRTKRAVSEVKMFIQRHMKVTEVKIGPELNHALWSRGNRHPPARVKIHTKKEEEYALVELEGVQFPTLKKEEKKKPETMKEKIEAKLEEKSESVKKQETEKLKEEKLEKELVKEGKVEEKGTKAPRKPSKGLKLRKEDQEKFAEEEIISETHKR